MQFCLCGTCQLYLTLSCTRPTCSRNEFPEHIDPSHTNLLDSWSRELNHCMLYQMSLEHVKGWSSAAWGVSRTTHAARPPKKVKRDTNVDSPYMGQLFFAGSPESTEKQQIVGILLLESVLVEMAAGDIPSFAVLSKFILPLLGECLR